MFPFNKNAKIICVDPDIQQLNRSRTVSLVVYSDVGPYVELINKESAKIKFNSGKNNNM